MHFVKKIPTTDEEKSIREKERAKKVKIFLSARDKIFKKRQDGELDTEMLALTGSILQKNPDIYTYWNIRRECLNKMIEQRQPEEDSEEKLKAKMNTEIANFLRDELHLTMECIEANPKSYSAWFQRGWVLQKQVELKSEQNFRMELALCHKALKMDCRNFHCWDHRRIVARLANLPNSEELEFSNILLAENFSNYSAWHYRAVLLPRIQQEKSGFTTLPNDVVEEELTKVTNAVFTDPADQSGWVYSRWLLDMFSGTEWMSPTSSSPAIPVTISRHNDSITVVMSKACEIDTILNYVDKVECNWNGFSALSNDPVTSKVWKCSFAPDCSCRLLETDNFTKLSNKPLINKMLLKTAYGLNDPIESGVVSSIISQCRQLLEVETEEIVNPIYMLTLSLIVANRRQYHEEILNNLEKLASSLDINRKQFYLNLKSRQIVAYELGKVNEKGITALDDIMNGNNSDLALRNLKLTSIDNLELLAGLLTSLDISGNNISSIDDLLLCNLTHLTLNENPIERIPVVKALSNVEFLSVASCPLKTVDSLLPAAQSMKLNRLVFAETPLSARAAELKPGLENVRLIPYWLYMVGLNVKKQFAKKISYQAINEGGSGGFELPKLSLIKVVLSVGFTLGTMWLLLALLAIARADLPIEDSNRVDCFPEPGASQQACEQRGCVWQAAGSTAPTGTPWCFYKRESGYTIASGGGNSWQLAANTPNPYGSNISPLTVTTGTLGSTVTVSIGSTSRYVPPTNFPKGSSSSSEMLKFAQTVVPNTNIFAFTVTRYSSGRKLWDTTIGGMQFADKFIQIATYLPSSNLFGFGEHVHKKLKHDLSRYTTWPMFARDIGPDSASPLSTQNLYGVHPFYIMMEPDGKAHGVFIFNSNAQEVVTGPGPHLIWRSIGGQIDLAFFPGPTPEEVVQQYLAYIGTPFLPAYWALGFQLSRWGYQNLTDMQTVITRVQNAGIPLDVPYADIDYMNHYEDFTDGPGWTGFPQYCQQLHSEGLHLILIFDPAIEADYGSFQRAINQNASFIEWAKSSQVPHNIQDMYPMAKNTLVMLGNVWPDNNTGFPDFLDPLNNTANWWYGEIKLFHDILGFDGMWIDMNEPSNFDTGTYDSIESVLATQHLSCPISGPDSTLDNPPYQTWAVYLHDGEHLSSKTLCMLGKTARRSHDFYDTKNLYGWSEARASIRALSMLGKRGAVISRSTFPSSGRYGGHWLGDNTARWDDLQTSVIGAMEFNFFGIPYVGSDICGFNGPSNEELCLRWQQMGAFHPFSRNHNSINMPPQDPAVWPSVAQASKTALLFRYNYLPYLYSLHYKVARFGGTVIRPLFFEFPHDETTQSISEQFLWGPAMMIIPALYPGITSIHAYIPSAIWYSLVPASYGQVVSVGYTDVPALNNTLTPVLVRGGYILPRQGANTTTTASRLNAMEVLIPIGSTSTCQGELYWDAGDDVVTDVESHARHHWQFSFTFTSTAASLQGICESCSSTVKINSLDVIEIIGYLYTPDFRSFTLNGAKVSINSQTSSYSSISRRMLVRTTGLVPLQNYAGQSVNSFNLQWNHSAI